ncbi:MAG: hypothetical protein IPK35_14690 [Saprospiraceae bacterium]|nr:hypothetical protein [Saprospiraceae bacterium]
MGKLIKYSKIWCNKTEVLPPNWLRAGQKGNQEIPLMDEGYEYRVPTMILLKKKRMEHYCNKGSHRYYKKYKLASTDKMDVHFYTGNK